MKNKKWIYILLLGLIIYYFSFSMQLFWDTGHYMSYVSILEGNSPWIEWDIVRGIIFPSLIFMSNLFFGKTTQGILILSFIFYVSMLFVVKLILSKIFNKEKEKTKKILFGLIFTILLVDPIVFGYYHTLLTEFVAMTLAIVMCYLTWQWIDIDFTKNKKEYVIYNIIFVLGTIFSWHLKQPYVTITIFPVIISTIISCFKNRTMRNIIQRVITICTCIICLILSIVLWNFFLASKGIDLNTNRNVTASFGNQLIVGLSNYELIKDFNIDEIQNDNMLSNDEKKKLNTGNYYLIKIKNTNSDIVDFSIIEKKDNNISTMNSIQFIVTQLLNHPYLVIDSYVSNYLAIADLYPKVTNDNVAYYVKKDFTLNYCHENCAIALGIANKKSNTAYMPDISYERLKNYEQFNDAPILFRGIFKIVSPISQNIFKILIGLLPFLTIISTIYYIKRKDNDKMIIVLILTWYSLMHILVHVATGANIDRYAAPAYISTILSYIIFIYLIVKNKKN